MSSHSNPKGGPSPSAGITPPLKNISRIVLVGGGHSHVQFLKSWALKPIAGVEVYLISKDAFTPYSGMLPSRLAGWYSDEQMHFDLRKLCLRSGVHLVVDEVTGIDAQTRKILLRKGSSLSYDVASINIGITPSLPAGARENPNVLAVKPIADLLEKWEKFDPDVGVTIVGAGSAGFELAVICKLLTNGNVQVLEASPNILPGHSPAVRRSAERILQHHKIQFAVGKEVVEIRDRILHCKSGEEIEFSKAVITTGARAAEWLSRSGLPVSDQGFVRVDANLRVNGFANLFAAGDCIEFSSRPLPKSGVYAVREGPVLTENLRRAIRGEQRLKKYRPQSKSLSLLVSGEHRALLSYRQFSLEGHWVWRWKDRIDRRFMKTFGRR